jgi:hypothetical protein
MSSLEEDITDVDLHRIDILMLGRLVRLIN